jgi:hypothetical protein
MVSPLAALTTPLTTLSILIVQSHPHF